MKSMSGLKIREHLENELGFEADRARRLPLAASSDEISTYWEGRKLPEVSTENFISMAKAALVSGVAGQKKINELVVRLITNMPSGNTYQSVSEEIWALAKKHQAILNLSRHRTTCVNAHLNILEPERTLTRVYGSLLADKSLKTHARTSETLLSRSISSSSELSKWILVVHELLEAITVESKVDDGEDFGDRLKGVISQKALPTYFKQWESFVREKVGPLFGVVIGDKDTSPLTGLLNNLEKSKRRSWTMIINDITELKSEPSFVKRLSTQTSTVSELVNHDLNMKDGRPLRIQISPHGVDRNLLTQFGKTMKAQFAVYGGSGPFSASTTLGAAQITVSLTDAKRGDFERIEEIILLHLI